jgi:hypothetical protein
MPSKFGRSPIKDFSNSCMKPQIEFCLFTGDPLPQNELQNAATIGQCRAALAKILGCTPGQLIIYSGGTTCEDSDPVTAPPLRKVVFPTVALSRPPAPRSAPPARRHPSSPALRPPDRGETVQWAVPKPTDGNALSLASSVPLPKHSPPPPPPPVLRPVAAAGGKGPAWEAVKRRFPDRPDVDIDDALRYNNWDVEQAIRVLSCHA